ncbi:MAG: GDSL-type esterase/lipase family protein [Pirellulaceae bacterium]
MKFVSFVLFLLISWPLAAAEPQWIWSAKNAATKADQGSAYFRKVFTLDEPESGSAEITADNAFELFLNGRRVGTGDSWNKRYKFNLTPLLLPGRNVLAIAANNGGPDPAGVAAKFTLKAKGKDAQTVVTDNTWKFHLKPQGTWARIESDDSAWESAFALGEYGKTAPWGAAGELVEGGSDTVVLSKPRNREKGLFEFRDGDRVVFLGSAFIERLQNTGHLETMLTAAMPSKNITFRNLGWSGDTVWGDARAVFGGRADGFKRLLSDVALCNPTVLIVCYGENEAYAGEAGLEEFRTGLSTLLDSLEATGARIVLLGPRQHEKLPPPLPDPAKYNADLRKYNDVIGQVAKEREHSFIDLYETLTPKLIPGDEVANRAIIAAFTLTNDGVHLSDYGYSTISSRLARLLGAGHEPRGFDVDTRAASFDATSIVLSNAQIHSNGAMFEGVDRHAPVISRESTHGIQEVPLTGFLSFKGLEKGKYEFRVDGVVVPISTYGGTFERALDNEALKEALYVDPKSQLQADSLRQAINEKNTLYFHRYRPQNETYLFLFRKHEQGNNAVEIPQFDPLIAELEKKIAELKQPVKQTYELIKVK